MTKEEFIKLLLDDRNNWSILDGDTHQFQQAGSKRLMLKIDSYTVTTSIRPGEDIEFLIERYKPIFANEIVMSDGSSKVLDKLYQEYITNNRDKNIGEILT